MLTRNGRSMRVAVLIVLSLVAVILPDHLLAEAKDVFTYDISLIYDHE
jgi:hypothetical protein